MWDTRYAPAPEGDTGLLAKRYSFRVRFLGEAGVDGRTVIKSAGGVVSVKSSAGVQTGVSTRCSWRILLSMNSRKISEGGQVLGDNATCCIEAGSPTLKDTKSSVLQSVSRLTSLRTIILASFNPSRLQTMAEISCSVTDGPNRVKNSQNRCVCSGMHTGSCAFTAPVPWRRGSGEEGSPLDTPMCEGRYL